MIGLSVYTAAFVCEAIRSGINTVPAGQAEAARAIGLTFVQTLRMVVLPQAGRAVVAPLGSIFIAPGEERHDRRHDRPGRGRRTR